MKKYNNPGNTTGYFGKEELAAKFALDKPFRPEDPPYPPSLEMEDEGKILAQRKAGMEQVEAIENAAVDGATYVIPSGVYRIPGHRTIRIRDVKNFTIRAEAGVEFYMEREKGHGFSQFIVFENCENCTLIGDAQTRLIVDCVPFASTQGKILHMDRTCGGRYPKDYAVDLIVQIPKGYVGYEGELLDYIGDQPHVHYNTFTDDGTWPGNYMAATVEMKRLSARQGRIALTTFTKSAVTRAGSAHTPVTG